MQFLGLSLAEWVAVLGLITAVVGFGRKIYKVIKNDIVKPAMLAMKSLEESIDGLAKNVDSETKWIHERHSEVVKKLNDHEDQLDRHELEIVKHRERIRTLYKDREKGYRQ